MKSIAIIPARSGSKGLKDKNIKELCGKPLIAYSIIAAKESGMFDTVMLSTDSEEYATIGKEYGAEVPFLRSAETSGDNAGSWDVVREVLSEYKKLGFVFDNVVLLQPTSPLRTAEDIIKAFNLKDEKRANAIVSVCEMDHSPLWSNTLPKSLSMQSFSRANDVPRQQLEKYYRVNGAIYLLDVGCLYNGKSVYENNCFAYIMPRDRSADIDTEFDFLYAETLYKKQCIKKED